MSEWPVVQLASVLERLESGRRPRGGAVTAGIPSIGGEHVRADGSVTNNVKTYIPPAFFDELSTGILCHGDILIVKDGATTGKTGIFLRLDNTPKAAVNEHVFLLRCDETRCLQNFAFHLLRSPVGNRMVMSDFRGAAQGGISRGFVAKVHFRLPPVDEQRRIVGLLDRAAEIRRRAEAARAKARAVIPALFLDTFGDPDANSKGWNVRPLAEVADIGSGLTKGRKLNGRATVLAPYLRVANVQDGFLNLSEIKTIEATPEDLEKCVLRPGDLLMTEGGDPDKLGRCAMWRGEIEGCLHQNHIFRVRIGCELLPDYAAAFMQTPAGKSFFLRVAKRTTGIASINKTQLGALPMLIPPLTLQAAYSERVLRVEALVRSLYAAAAKAEAMAAALSAEVFDARAAEGVRDDLAAD